MFPVDSANCRLYIGDAVVYNLSGTLARGVIVKIVPRTDSVAKNNPQFKNLQWVITMDNGSVVKNTDGIYRLDT